MIPYESESEEIEQLIFWIKFLFCPLELEEVATAAEWSNVSKKF